MGDFIVIQEKVDGSNASIAYDRETDRLVAFSRKYELRFELTLSGSIGGRNGRLVCDLQNGGFL